MILAAVVPVEGAVLCKKKSGAVLVRESACTKKETALDLATFGASGPGAVTKSASVNADGSVQNSSSGVSVSKIGTAQYRVTFAPGTWPPTGYNAIFSPLGGATVLGQFTNASPDGSGIVEVTLSAEVVFLFIAVGT